jgi:hypothetical protein
MFRPSHSDFITPIIFDTDVCLLGLITLMMEAESNNETSVNFYQTTHGATS